jgi:hypothetical protein
VTAGPFEASRKVRTPQGKDAPNREAAKADGK